uniref:Translocon-associated protein subunit gamma n=1 Tax=Ixodes ricinus TaxID=34613 RepID=V5HD00_IXORI
MDLYQSAIVFAVMTLLCTWLIAFAYKSVKFVLKHKVAPKREDAVSREIMKKLSDDKKMYQERERMRGYCGRRMKVRQTTRRPHSTIFYNKRLVPDAHHRDVLLHTEGVQPHGQLCVLRGRRCRSAGTLLHWLPVKNHPFFLFFSSALN